MARPGDAGDFVIARAIHGHAAGRARDHGLHRLNEIELIGFAALQRLAVFGGLVLGHGGTRRDLDPMQPFDVEVALPTRHQQAHGIALFRADAFAILEQGKNALLMRFCEGNGARQTGGITALCQNPFAFGLDAGFVQQQAQLHAGPFGAGQKAMNGPRVRLNGLGSGERTAVAAAFQKMDRAMPRIAQQRIHAEFQRLVDQSMDQKLVGGRIDIGHAIMMALIMQPVGRDDAFQQFQGRVRRTGARRNARRSCDALHRSLVRRRHAIAAEGLARCGHGRGDVVVGAGGNGGGDAGARQSGFEEFAACGFLVMGGTLRLPLSFFKPRLSLAHAGSNCRRNTRKTCTGVIFLRYNEIGYFCA